MQITLIDDEPTHVAHMRHALQLPLPGQDGRTQLHTIGSVQVLQALQPSSTAADAMVVDWRMLREFGGVLPPLTLPAGTGRAPALVLLPRHVPEHDLRRALGVGAEDYAFKPITAAELRWRLARLAVPRGAPVPAPHYGHWRLDALTHSVHVRADAPRPGQPPLSAMLTECEFRLLACLMRQRDTVVSRDYLIASASMAFQNPDSRSLDTHIYRLRRKLPLDGSRGLLLQGIYRGGYRLCATQEVAAGRTAEEGLHNSGPPPDASASTRSA